MRTRDIAGDRRPRGAGDGASPDASDAGVNGVPAPPPVSDPGEAKASHAKVVAKASARAIALDDTHVYYGDSDDDGVYAIAKAGGQAMRIARHAPVSGALALEGGFVTWVASPGDAVLRAPTAAGPQPTTLRDKGIFSDVAALGDDVFITEAIGAGGALYRVTGATSTKLAAFDGAPRAVMADKTHAFVITPSKIFRVPRQRGDLETVGTGARFSHAELDEAFVYVVGEVQGGRAIVRFAKAGGDPTIVVRDVRDAPIEVYGGEVLYFDAVRPALRAVPIAGGTSRVVMEDENLSTVSAVEADETTVYVARGIHETGAIVAIPRLGK